MDKKCLSCKGGCKGISSNCKKCKGECEEGKKLKQLSPNNKMNDFDNIFNGGSQASGYIKLLMAKKAGKTAKDYPLGKAREKKTPGFNKTFRMVDYSKNKNKKHAIKLASPYLIEKYGRFFTKEFLNAFEDKYNRVPNLIDLKQIVGNIELAKDYFKDGKLDFKKAFDEEIFGKFDSVFSSVGIVKPKAPKAPKEPKVKAPKVKKSKAVKITSEVSEPINFKVGDLPIKFFNKPKPSEKQELKIQTEASSKIAKALKGLLEKKKAEKAKASNEEAQKKASETIFKGLKSILEKKKSKNVINYLQDIKKKINEARRETQEVNSALNETNKKSFLVNNYEGDNKYVKQLTNEYKGVEITKIKNGKIRSKISDELFLLIDKFRTYANELEKIYENVKTEVQNKAITSSTFEDKDLSKRKQNITEEERTKKQKAKKEAKEAEDDKKERQLLREAIEATKKELEKKRKLEKKKSESKTEPKAEPKAESKISKTKRRKLLDLISDTLGGSKRDITKLKKQFEEDYPEFSDNKVIKSIISGKDLDFYPTPTECLNKDKIKSIIKQSESILEPTAGLGSILDFIEEINPKANITANELNEDFIPLLEKLFSDVKITNKNFLEYDNKNSFDAIICNPPFSLGSDKKGYLQFLFKCLELLNNSSFNGNKDLIFICPSFIKKEKFVTEEFLKNSDVVNSLSKYVDIPVKKLKIIIQDFYNEDYDNEENTSIAENIVENIVGFWSGEEISKCKGFGGTNVEASIYHFTVLKNFSKVQGKGKTGVKGLTGGIGPPPGYLAQKMANRAQYQVRKRFDEDPAYQADLQKKREEFAKANPYECRYIYAPKEDIDKGDNPEEFEGIKISRTRTRRMGIPCEEYVKEKMEEYARYKQSNKGFWQQFADGFFGPIKMVADIVSNIPGIGSIGKAVSTGIGLLGYGKPDGYELHTVVIKKPIDLVEAKRISKNFITKSKEYNRETKTSYRFRNIPKQKFEPKSFRTKKVNKQISLIYGKLK